jgi:hypothetical protein
MAKLLQVIFSDWNGERSFDVRAQGKFEEAREILERAIKTIEQGVSCSKSTDFPRSDL